MSTVSDAHIRFEPRGDNHIDRQHELAICRIGLGDDLAGDIGELLLVEGLADRLAARREKRIGHGAADEQIFDLAHEVAEKLEFGRDFRAADDRRQRTLWVGQHPFQHFKLMLHAAPDIGRELVRHPFGRSVRAMGGGKSVVDVNIAEFGQGVHEGRIVLRLGGMEPCIFEHEDVAVVHRIDRALRDLAGAVGRKGDIASELAFNLHRDGL